MDGRAYCMADVELVVRWLREKCMQVVSLAQVTEEEACDLLAEYVSAEYAAKLRALVLVGGSGGGGVAPGGGRLSTVKIDYSNYGRTTSSNNLS